MATRKRATKKDIPESAAAAAAVPEVKPAQPAPEAKTVEVPEVKAPSGNEPNVIWRGDKEPPESVRIGMTSIALPDAGAQRAGFYSEHSTRIVRQINGYKFLKPKGAR